VRTALDRLVWRATHRDSPPCHISIECPFISRDSH
jgi:hypothetical protein